MRYTYSCGIYNRMLIASEESNMRRQLQGPPSPQPLRRLTSFRSRELTVPQQSRIIVPSEFFSQFFSVHQAGVNNLSAGQDISRSLRNPCSVRNSLPSVVVVYHVNLAHSFKFDFSKTRFNIILTSARTQTPI